MKTLFKKPLLGILGFQVRWLRSRHQFKIVGVVGSIGKTSTKLAIAKVLAKHYRVRFQEGNYNDLLSVPLVFFGANMPSLWNPLAWLWLILKNTLQILGDYPFDFVVLELGTDGPGQISQFRRYLQLDLAVLTAVAPEHMEFFRDLQSVAEEEWSVAFFSDSLLVNRDLVETAPENIDHNKVVFYGKNFGATYKLTNITKNGHIFNFTVQEANRPILELKYEAFAELELYSVTAAAVVALHYKVPSEKIIQVVGQMSSFAGRLQKLKGIKNSLIIDDTYNASPTAVRLALETLYQEPAAERVAILGMMNELGETSESEHQKIGELCDSRFLSLLVTVGDHANRFLAPRALARGCQVYVAKNARDAGHYVVQYLKPGTIILAKGSQNGVFVEEALKPLLANPTDESKLVRQDSAWLQKKEKFFQQF